MGNDSAGSRPGTKILTPEPTPSRVARATEVVLGGVSALAHRHPFKTLLLASVLTAVALLSARKLVVDPDIANMLPRSVESTRNLDQLKARFGGIGYVTVLVSGADTEKLKRFAGLLASRLEKLPEVRFVDYRRPVEFFKSRAFYYMELEDLREIKRRVDKRVKWEKLRANPLYVDLEDTPPPRIDVEDIVDKQKRRARRRFRLLQQDGDDYYVDQAGRRLLLLIKPAAGSTDLDFSRSVLERIKRTVAGLLREAPNPAIKVAYSGRYTKRVEQQDAITQDLRFTSIVALILMLLYLGFHFRRVTSVGLVMGPLLIGLVWTFGWAAAMVDSLNLLSAFIGVILLGMGMDHGIHLLGRYQAEHNAGEAGDEAVRKGFASTGRGVVVAATTTAAAFIGLGLTEFRGFHEFGVIAAGGVVAQLIAYVLVMPALIALATRLGWRVPDRHHQRPSPLCTHVKRWSPLLFWISVVALGAVMLDVGQVRFQYDFAALDRRDLPSYRLDHDVNKLLGYSQTPLVVLTESERDARRVTEEIQQRQRRRGASSGVHFTATLRDFIPRQQTEKHRLMLAITQVLLDADQKSLTAKEHKRVDALLRAARHPPFGPNDLPQEVQRQFRAEDGQGRFVLVFPAIRLSDGAKVRQLARELRNLPLASDSSKISAAGEAMVLADVLDLIFREAPRLMMVSVAFVFVVLWLLMGSLRTALLGLVPPTVTLLATVGLMSLADLRFNYLNIVMIPVLFGVAVDGGVHLALQGQRTDFYPDVLANVGRAISGSLATTMLGFGSLMLIDHPGLRSLAQLALLGLSVNLLVCLLLMPALLALPKVIQRRWDAAKPSSDQIGVVGVLATVGGAGYSPIAPGTVGALAAIPAGWALAQLIWPAQAALLAASTLLSVWIVKCFLVGRHERDPQEIVLDEFIGVLIALAFVEWRWPWVIAAFLLFRLFDIWKPWPIRTVDRRAPGAWGVMGDDVLAGLAAGAVLLCARFVVLF